jgi:hypothetical protein
MKKLCLLLVLWLGLSGGAWAQRYTVSGYIRDAATGEALIGASLYFPRLRAGTTANAYGFYSISLPPADTLGAVVSYVGYAPQLKQIQLTSNRRLDVGLVAGTTTLDEVTVRGREARNNDNVVRPQMGIIDVPLKLINTLPVLFGERDPLKIIQLLPGVQAGDEGTTGYHVRGGATDQNLVVLDEATVYNPNHLFGLFSTFNAAALSKVTLIKGGFPAQYGGRLSSFLDISLREGSRDRVHVDGGLGLITSNLTVDGPLGHGKGSFIVSGRRSYLDLLTKPFNLGTNYYFYDTNVKANYDLGSRDRVYLSLFRGRDVASYVGSSSLNYDLSFGNTTGTLRWNHVLSPKAFVNTSFIANDYALSVQSTQGGYLDQLASGVRDFGGKVDLDFYPTPAHQLKAGLVYTRHRYAPVAASAKIPKAGTGTLETVTASPIYASEAAAYVNDEVTISPRLGVNLGLRAPVFTGADATYFRLEPRATVRYGLGATASVKLAYTRMNQFFNELPSSTASFPTDLYLPSSRRVLPQVSDQVALGYFRNFQDNAWEVSVEGYYKTMDHQVNFAEGTLLSAAVPLETQLVFGQGRSVGVELFVRRHVGRLTGWVSYTLSKTDQTFPDLNFGRTFPFRYDRRHNLAVVASYELSQRWTLAANFVFSTGNPITLPNGRVSISGGGSLYDTFYYDYTDRNSYRLGNYHRLDLSATYKKPRHFFGHPYDSEWVFGVYNAYSRLNPYFVYLEVDPLTRASVARQVALLPIIPSVAYHFSF